MNSINNKRGSLRVGIKKLTSIVKKAGEYVVPPGDDSIKKREIKILDISTGGLCIESKHDLKSGIGFHLEIPKIGNLDAATIPCDVTRSLFKEDPLIFKNLGTDRDKSYYEIGLKFKVPNTEYVKQLYKLAVSHKI